MAEAHAELRLMLRGLCSILVATLALTACQQETRVAVECLGNGAGYQCTLKHTQGGSAAKACWDVAVTCHNGTKAIGSGCQTVEPEGKATAFIPVSDMKGAEGCDVATTVNVQNLRVTAPGAQ